VYVPLGVIMNKWTPATEGAGFEMTPTLAALAPFRDQILVLSGLDQKRANPEPGEGGAFHTRASAVWLTGVHPKQTMGVDIRGGVSVDQLLARSMGKQTQLGSLELGMDPNESSGVCEPGFACTYMNTLCWRGPQTPLPMENSPRAVFERLFGDSETTDSAARLKRMQENRSLLDAMTEDVAHLQTGLGPNDRAKLTEYLDAVRDVERRIQIAEEQSARELPTLERPGGGFPASFEAYAKLMFDLQVLALQADLTRVITYRIAKEQSNRAYREIGIPDGHHGLSHHMFNPVAIEKLTRINEFHVKLLAYYLGRLKATPDGDGTLLDHMMLIYGSGIADGNLHTNENLPTLMLGRGAGKIKGGRHVRYPTGTPMTNLFLSMLEMAGTPMDNLGDSNGKLDLLSLG
jgi:hypothetical protein